MIKVLQFADVINRHDFIDNLVRYSDPAEFQMSVCVRTEDHRIARPEFPAGTNYRLLSGNSRRHAPKTAIQLARLLQEWDIDVLHAHHFEQMIVGWIATRLHPKTKLIVGRHYSDAIYRNRSRLKRSALLALEKRVNSHAARIIVPSRMIAEILIDRQGVSPGKVDVVHYGFVPEKYSAVSPAEVTKTRHELEMNDRFVVGNFSRLHEEKGHRYLLEAALEIRQNIPKLLVLIVGEGPERKALERQIRESELNETVKLLGWRKDAMAIMSSVDAIVQSTLQEAFSQVMCEALWLGKPLLMTDVSGARDVITDGVNGLIVPKENPVALARGVEKLASEPKLLTRLGNAGKLYVTEILTIDKIIPFYEESFRRARDGRSD